MKLSELFHEKINHWLKSRYGKYFLYLFGAAFFLAACFFCFFAGSDLSEKVVLDTDSLNLTIGEYIAGKGCTITEADISDSNVPFGSRNDILLRKGSYRVTITYEADSDGNMLTFSSPDDAFGSLKADSFRLRSDLTSMSGIIRINDTRSDYILTATYCGKGNLTIKNILIEQTNDRLFSFCTTLILFVCFLILFIVLFQKIKSKEQKNALFFLLLICAISSLPLCVDYLFKGHDLPYHLMRIEGIREGLMAGMFPVKIHPNLLHEYGYASPIMYGDLFLYIPALLRMSGYTVIDAYRSYIFFVNIATCFFSYWCIKKIVHSDYIGVLGSALYTLSAYRFTNVYVRSAVGEYTAMVFLPLIFCGLYLIYDEKEKTEHPNEGIILSAIGFSGIIQTHVLTCEIVGIFTIISCLFLWKKTFRKSTFFALTKVVLFSLIINLWWLVPFLDYRTEEIIINYTNAPYIQARGNFIAQLFMPFSNVSGQCLDAEFGLVDEMPLTLGLSLTCGIIFFFYLFFFGRKITDKKYAHLAIFTMLMGILSLFMTTIYFPYDKLSDISLLAHKYLAIVQFPFRFLIIATLFISISTCIVILLFKKFYKPEVTAGLVFIIGICILIPYFYSTYSLLTTKPPYRPYDYIAFDSIEIGLGEYLPLGIELADSEHLSALDYLPGEGVELNSYSKKYLSVQLDLENTGHSESYIEVPLFYYKGYIAVDESDHSYFPVSRSEHGNLQVALPADYQGRISITFREPWYWRAAEVCSLLTIVFLILYQSIKKYRKHFS